MEWCSIISYNQKLAIIIFSQNQQMRELINTAIDQALKYRLADLTDIYPDYPNTIEELCEIVWKKKITFIIMALDSNAEEEACFKKIGRELKKSHFLFISESDTICKWIIQNHIHAYGMIWSKDVKLSVSIQKYVTDFISETSVEYEGIFAKQDMDTFFVPFQQIYYIETIKRTHQCQIYFDGGQALIRKDINNLIQDLDARFCICRASTIVNISRIRNIDFTERVIEFEKNVYCYFSESKAPVLRYFCKNGLIEGQVLR